LIIETAPNGAVFCGMAKFRDHFLGMKELLYYFTSYGDVYAGGVPLTPIKDGLKNGL
jgi:hypothetical protein